MESTQTIHAELHPFDEYERKLEKLKETIHELPIIWQRLLEHSISVCDSYKGNLDGFRSTIHTLECHLSQVELLRQEEGTSLECSYLRIKKEYEKLPKDIPRTMTVRKRIEKSVNVFPAFYSEELLNKSLECLQSNVSFYAAAIERWNQRKRPKMMEE